MTVMLLGAMIELKASGNPQHDTVTDWPDKYDGRKNLCRHPQQSRISLAVFNAISTATGTTTTKKLRSA